ncbi:MAG: sulfatase [Bacteroidales bacterium]
MSFRQIALGLIPMAITSCNHTGNKQESGNGGYKNVVVVISDDHAPHTMGTYGNDHIRTPHIDRLAQNGIQFNNAYCNAPICSASRQSVLTGKYPQATGVTLLFTPFNPQNNTTIANHLQDEGFKTALFGKTHFNDWLWYPVWDEWPKYGFDTLILSGDYSRWRDEVEGDAIPDQGRYYSRANAVENPAGFWNADYLPHQVYDDYSKGTFFADRAIEFIRQNKDDRFLVWLAFNEPHAPFHFPAEFRDRYDPEQLELPAGSAEDDRWIPEIFADFSDEEKRGIIASYYTSVEYMDKNLGKVIDALEAMELDENTLVIYLSDNGYLLYDHKRFEKHTMWKESVQIPMIFSGKGLPEGVKSDAIIEGVDLVTTICDLLDVPAMPNAQGMSFKEVLKGKKTDLKPYAYSLFLEDNMAMIASKEWKYIFMTGKRDLGLEYATGLGAPGITHFLYDLKNDPGETTNLADDPDFRTRKENLQDDLLAWFKETHPEAHNLPETLTTDGQLMWFCEPRDVGAEYGGTPLRIIPDQKQ